MTSKTRKIRPTGLDRSIDVSDGNVSGYDFTHTDLSWSIFTRAFCARSDFTGSILAETSFREADLRRSDFTDADLTCSDFTGAANLQTCTFTGAIISGATGLDHLNLVTDEDGRVLQPASHEDK